MVALEVVLGSTTIIALASRALPAGRTKSATGLPEPAADRRPYDDDAGLRADQDAAVLEVTSLIRRASSEKRGVAPRAAPSMLIHDGLSARRYRRP